MGFWFYMLFICSLIPLTMIVFGYCFEKKHLKKSIRFSDTEREDP